MSIYLRATVADKLNLLLLSLCSIQHRFAYIMVMFRRPQMILLIRFLSYKHLLKSFISRNLCSYKHFATVWKKNNIQLQCKVPSQNLVIWSYLIWSNKSRKNLQSDICEVRKKHTSLEVPTPPSLSFVGPLVSCFLSCRTELLSLSWLHLSLASVLLHEHLAQICLFLYMVTELWIFWELTS